MLTLALVVLALLALIVPAAIREPVAAAVRQTVGAPLIELQERAENTRAAFLAHDSTSRVVDSLALESMDVAALRAENDHLRDLLGLSARLRWGFLVSSADFLPASALGDRSLGREVMLTLNVGSRSGVTPYSPVVAPEGVVGRVRSVDPTSSLVELYSHENFRLSAMTADQRVLGIVRPHLGDAKDEYIPAQRSISWSARRYTDSCWSMLHSTTRRRTRSSTLRFAASPLVTDITELRGKHLAKRVVGN